MRNVSIATILAALAIPAMAHAQAQPIQLTTSIVLEKIVRVDGKDRVERREPKTVLPGDRLSLETHYQNRSQKPVTRFVVTNPVPKSVAFEGESSAGVEVSVDGGKSWGRLSQLKVGEGAAARPAVPNDVTHLRWVLASVAPGASGVLRYRGTVR